MSLTSGNHEVKSYCNHPCNSAILGPKALVRSTAEHHILRQRQAVEELPVWHMPSPRPQALGASSSQLSPSTKWVPRANQTQVSSSVASSPAEPACRPRIVISCKVPPMLSLGKFLVCMFFPSTEKRVEPFYSFSLSVSLFF